MATRLPPPPVPAGADLTHYDDMPLEVRRLRDSGIAGVPDAEIFRSAVLLWCVAWHQIPAGSLPNDDAELCRLVGLGRDLKTWRKIRAGVLRGWREFADGRLYHKVVAEKAVSAWNGTLFNRWGKECDRIRKENKAREKRRETPLELPPRPTEIPLEWPGASVGIPPESPAVPPENGLNRIEGNGSNREDSTAAESCTDTARALAGDVPAETPTPDAPTGGPRDAATVRALVDEAFALWVPVAYDLKIPDPGFLNADRRELLAARLAECGWIDGWKVALEQLRAAKFLRDEADPTKPKPWVNLGALLKPETFTGLMEGRYAERDDPSKRNGHQGPARSSAIRTAANFAAALGGLGAGGPGGSRRREDRDGLEAAHASHPSRNPQDGE